MGLLAEGPQVISLDEMSKISYAAGGEGTDYDFVTYIAKDKRDNRCMLDHTSPSSVLSHTRLPRV
jgi:hypothetical protein